MSTLKTLLCLTSLLIILFFEFALFFKVMYLFSSYFLVSFCFVFSIFFIYGQKSCFLQTFPTWCEAKSRACVVPLFGLHFFFACLFIHLARLLPVNLLGLFFIAQVFSVLRFLFWLFLNCHKGVVIATQQNFSLGGTFCLCPPGRMNRMRR